MTSVLAWIDHDPHERERMTRILALFKERESRDELGLGAMRDSIADLLFPGTSTIMTRLRYAFFIPWIYRELEAQSTPFEEVPRRARKEQTDLVGPLLDAAEEGVLGRLAKGQLKRLPSSVYWAGLVSWGFYQGTDSLDSYHRSFARRKRARTSHPDDLDVTERPPSGWHPAMPAAPEDLKEVATFELTRPEAQFFKDRIVEMHPDSFLAWLVNESIKVPDIRFPWEHPAANVTPQHREQLEHARLLSEAAHGAALLYNLMLAEVSGRKDDEQEFGERLRKWSAALHNQDRPRALRSWNLDRFWQLTIARGFNVSASSRVFLQQWLESAGTCTFEALTSNASRVLVRERERKLKGTRSRFDNATARQQWSGASGVGRMDFRWPVTTRLLRDLQKGLEAPDAAT